MEINKLQLIRELTNWIDSTDVHNLDTRTIASLKTLKSSLTRKLDSSHGSRSDFTSTRWKAIRELNASNICIKDNVLTGLTEWTQAPDTFFAPHIVGEGSAEFLSALWHTITASLGTDTSVSKLRFRIAVTALAALHTAQPRRDALAKELHELLLGSFDKALYHKFVEGGKRYHALFEKGLGSLRTLACIPDDISKTVWEVNMPLTGELLQQVARKLAEVSVSTIAMQEFNTKFIESVPARMVHLYQQRPTSAFRVDNTSPQEPVLYERWFYSQFENSQCTAIGKRSFSGDMTHRLAPSTLTPDNQPCVQDFILTMIQC